MNKLRKSLVQWFIVVVLFSVLTISSCSHKQSSPIVPASCNLPDTVSFKNNVIPVFEVSCDQPNCHSGNDTSSRGRVNLEPSYAYANLFKQHLIDTLKPTQSQLYQRLISANNSMPPGIYLDNCTIQTILKWIEQGARNN